MGEASQGENGNIVIIVPIVLAILILGAMFGFIMILVMRKHQKKKIRQLNIQAREKGMGKLLFSF